MTYEELMQNAIDVSKHSYSPYSKFPVGACVLAERGEVYSGCNFENSSLGLTICAERNAIGTAIANGERVIKAVAIYSPKQDNCTPCGACRQVMMEFCDKDFKILLTDGNGQIKEFTLGELLPESFSL